MGVEYGLIVRFWMTEDGGKEENNSWHMVQNIDSPRAFCNGQAYGYGEGRLENRDGHDYDEKIGKITCKHCRQLIKGIKKVKL